GFLSTTVSATIGVTSLSLGGYASWDRFGAIWLTWWLGDVSGALVVAPVLILWGTNRVALTRTRALEFGLLLGSVVLVGDLVFGGLSEAGLVPVAALVQSSDDAIIGKTLEGVVTSWNSGAERLYGYSAREVIGRLIGLIIPQELDGELPGILERLGRGERIDHYDAVRVTKDGRRIDVSQTVSPTLDAEGRIIGVSSIARDITHRKQAEATIRERDALRYVSSLA